MNYYVIAAFLLFVGLPVLARGSDAGPSVPNCAPVGQKAIRALGLTAMPMATSHPPYAQEALWDENYRYRSFVAQVEFSGRSCHISKIQFTINVGSALTLKHINSWLENLSVGAAGHTAIIVAKSRRGVRRQLVMQDTMPVVTLLNFNGANHVVLTSRSDVEGSHAMGIAHFRFTPFFFRVSWPEGGAAASQPLWPDCD